MFTTSTLYWIILFLGAYGVATTWYIRRLHARLRATEHDWVVIEELADHNRDGDVILHVRHIGKDDADQPSSGHPNDRDGSDSCG